MHVMHHQHWMLSKEGKGGEERGGEEREGKGREGKGRAGQGREGKGGDRPAGLQLKLWVFCEGYTNGVTQTVHKERSDSNG